MWTCSGVKEDQRRDSQHQVTCGLTVHRVLRLLLSKLGWWGSTEESRYLKGLLPVTPSRWDPETSQLDWWGCSSETWASTEERLASSCLARGTVQERLGSMSGSWGSTLGNLMVCS